jgi:CHAT domain-containing protein/tetratricopeptide (TPR) repeat protein
MVLGAEGLAGSVMRGLRAVAAALILCLVVAAPALPQGAQLQAAAPSIAELERRAEKGDAEAMAALGDAYRTGSGVEKNLDTAIEWYDRADTERDAYGSFWLGYSLKQRLKRGDLDRALLAFENARKPYEKALGKSHPEVATLYDHIGETEQLLGRYAEAVTAYERVVEIRTEVFGPDSLEVADSSVSLANAEQQAGLLDEPERRYRDALAVYRSRFGENHETVASVLLNLGALMRKSGNFGEAAKLYGEALTIRTAMGSDAARIADIQYNLCRLRMDLELAAEALKACDAALAFRVSEFGQDHPDVALVENMRGGALERLGRHAEAVAALEWALQIFEKQLGPDHPYTLDARSNLPIVLAAAGQTEKARAAYRRVLAALTREHGPGHADVARTLSNLASLESDLGNTDEARTLSLRALAIGLRTPERAYTTDGAASTLSHVLEDGGKPNAARFFAKMMINALQHARASVAADPVLAAAFDEALTTRYTYLVDRLAADGSFAEAQFVAGLVKAGELSSYSGRADTLERVRLTRGEEALEIDFLRAIRPYQALLGRLDAEHPGDPGKARDERVQKLLAELLGAEAEMVAKVDALVEKFEGDRIAADAERVALNERLSERQQAELAKLGADVVSYQALATEQAVHLFVSAAGRETVHRQVDMPRGAVALYVNDTVAAIERHDPRVDAQLAELYDVLWKPVAADVEAAKPGVVVLNLSGFLRYVPYAALRGPDGYLVEKVALSVATPSVETRSGKPRSAKDVSGAGFAVTEPHGAFAALPGAARELEAIFTGEDGAGPLKGKPVIDAKFGIDALKSALKKKPRFVHIASHFSFAPGREDNSFLLMGDGNGLDLKTLRSDNGLKFNGVDLVVLSACETARGGGSEGEEIESIGVLAQQRGAGAVMASLWRIADDSTATLMADFYRGLVGEGLDKARALQRAQIAMIHGGEVILASQRSARPLSAVPAGSTAHPYYWSAFVLMGNWK